MQLWARAKAFQSIEQTASISQSTCTPTEQLFLYSYCRNWLFIYIFSPKQSTKLDFSCLLPEFRRNSQYRTFVRNSDILLVNSSSSAYLAIETRNFSFVPHSWNFIYRRTCTVFLDYCWISRDIVWKIWLNCKNKIALQKTCWKGVSLLVNSGTELHIEDMTWGHTWNVFARS